MSRSVAIAQRLCDWCGGPISDRARRDAKTCSTPCRQAKHRVAAVAGNGSRVAGATLRLAYADPPYPGRAVLYRGHPDYAGEVDHAELLSRLATYDGWALSTSATALPNVLALCVAQDLTVRVAAWHRGERPNRSALRPLNAWEPVVYAGGRYASVSSGSARRVDSLVCGVTALRTLPGRVLGTKPAKFCRWVFDLLGAAAGDTLDDLYPGSGIVARAWREFTKETSG